MVMASATHPWAGHGHFLTAYGHGFSATSRRGQVPWPWPLWPWFSQGHSIPHPRWPWFTAMACWPWPWPWPQLWCHVGIGHGRRHSSIPSPTVDGFQGARSNSNREPLPDLCLRHHHFCLRGHLWVCRCIDVCDLSHVLHHKISESLRCCLI